MFDVVLLAVLAFVIFDSLLALFTIWGTMLLPLLLLKRVMFACLLACLVSLGRGGGFVLSFFFFFFFGWLVYFVLFLFCFC